MRSNNITKKLFNNEFEKILFIGLSIYLLTKSFKNLKRKKHCISENYSTKCNDYINTPTVLILFNQNMS